MCPTPMIVAAVGGQESTQVRFVDHDHVIQTLAADRTDQSFRIRILSRA
jgi:hypothetical protein